MSQPDKTNEEDVKIFPMGNGEMLFMDKLTERNRIGRYGLVEKISNWLKKTQGGSGSILIGGYRGAGKTTVAHRVIEEYKKDNKDKLKLLCMSLHFADENKRNKTDVLSELIQTLSNELTEAIYGKTVFEGVKRFIPFLIILCFFFIGLGYLFQASPSSLVFNQSAPFIISLSLYFFISIVIVFLGELASRHRRIISGLNNLVKSLNGHTTNVSSFKNKYLSQSKQYKSNPVSPNLAVNSLEKILFELRHNSIWYMESVLKPWAYRQKTDVIFLIDELDKLNSSTLIDENGIEQSDDSLRPQELILSQLKGFISNAQARFIFVSDRRMLDRYNSESVKKNSLYDGLFNNVFYVNSLITEQDQRNNTNPALHKNIEGYLLKALNSENCNALQERATKNTYNYFKRFFRNSPKEEYKNHTIKSYVERISPNKNYSNTHTLNEAANIRIYILKRFVEFVTLYSWGIPRRMKAIISSYTTYDNKENKYSLVFKEKDIQWFIFASKIYESIDHGLATHLSKSDDKLIISTFIGIHEILRFHSIPFSFQYLQRTEEGISAHIEPNLANIVSNIMESVFDYTIRKIHCGLFDYRFYGGIQEEINELTRIHGTEASLFNLTSVDANSIINYYKKMQLVAESEGSAKSEYSKAMLNSIVGDIYLWERAFDLAHLHYSQAASYLKVTLRDSSGTDMRRIGLPSFASQFTLCRVCLKLGLVEEMRKNYQLAIRLYRSAAEVAKEHLGKEVPIKKSINDNDYNENTNKAYEASDRISSAINDFWESSGSKVDYRETLVLSVLAMDSASIKLGRKGRGDIKGSILDITPYYKYDSALSKNITSFYSFNKEYKNDGYLNLEDRVDYNSELYQKVMLVRLISNDYSFVIEKLSPLIEYFYHWNDKGKPHLFYAESMLVALWSQAKILSVSEQSKSPRIIIKAFIEASEILSDLETQKNEGAIQAHYEFFMSSFSKSDIDGVTCAIVIQYLAARRLENLKYRVRAGYIYILLNSLWSVSLEHPLIDHAELSGEEPDLIDLIRNRMYKCSSTADSGNFSDKRQEWLDEEGLLDNIKEDRRYTSDTIKSVLSSNGENEKYQRLFDSFPFWHRSSMEMDVLITDLWCTSVFESHHMQLNWNAKTESDLVIKCITNPMHKSMLMWFKGKALAAKILRHYQAETCERIEGEDIIEAYKVLCSSYVYRQTSEINGVSLLYPMKSQVLFLLLRLYKIYLDRFGSDIQLKFNSLYQELRVPKEILNESGLTNKINEELSLMSNIRNRDSKMYRSMLKERYFLADDFDAPRFKIEWFIKTIQGSFSDGMIDKFDEYTSPKSS